MAYTPIWPRYQIDNQGTGKCDYTVSGFSPYWIYPISGGYGYIVSSIVISYNSSTNGEVVYFATSKRYLFALDVSSKTILWTIPLLFNGNVGDLATIFLTLSKDGNTLYCTSGYHVGGAGGGYYEPNSLQIQAVNTIDGSNKWTFKFDQSYMNDVELKILSPIFVDKNNDLHIIVRQLPGSYHLFLVKVQEDRKSVV